MDASLMLIYLVAVPLGIAALNILVPPLLQKIFTFFGLAYTIILVYLLFQEPTASLTFMDLTIFSVDRLGLFVLVFIQLLSFIILIFLLHGLDKANEKKFLLLYPLTVAFCNGVIVSENILLFIIFWGLSGLALYLFALLGQTADTPKTAKKTFIIIGGSDAFLIFGLVAMRFLQPGTNWSLFGLHITLNCELAWAAFISLLLAAFAKAGGFPLHTWVPDFSKDAPVESAAFLPASLDKLLGIYLLARMMTVLFEINVTMHLVIITLGAMTVIFAVMMAMIQHNGRKLLGYHAVSQVGYMIIGIGSGCVLAFAGGLFHLINHTIYKSNLFLTLGSVEKQTGTNDLDQLGGLGKKMPITFIMAIIGAFSISGIPPFNGFFSKWMIYQGLLEMARGLTPAQQLWLLVCLVLAVFGSALTLASFLKFLHAIFLGKRPAKYNNIREAKANQWLATGLLSALCILFGLFALQIPLQKLIYPALVENGFAIPEFLGTYNPLLILGLFAFAFIIGIIVYLAVKNVRFDENYLGGMPALEKFRVSGTGFYNEIRNMRPLQQLYNAAEKRYFDIYDLGTRITFSLSGLFQKCHPGQLQLYVLYILIGVLVFILLIH